MTNSEGNSDDATQKVDGLIALAFKLEEEEKELAKFPSADVELSPSEQASLNSLGPDLMQRMIAAEAEVRVQFTKLDDEGVLRTIKDKLRIVKVGDSKHSSTNIVILPGLKGLLAQLELALAAAESRPALRDYVYLTRDQETKVIFRLGGRGNFTISVWDKTGELSDQLNDCEILATGGTVIAKILAGGARVPGIVLKDGFFIRDPTGKPVEITLRS